MLKQLLGHDDEPNKLDVAIYTGAAVVAVLKAIDKIVTYKSLNKNQGAR